MSLGELADAAGVRWVLQRELSTLRSGVVDVLVANPFVSGLALLSLLMLRRGPRIPYLFALLLMG